MQEGAISPLSHRASSGRSRRRSCRPEAGTIPWPTGRRNDLLKLDVADFYFFQALQAGHGHAGCRRSRCQSVRCCRTKVMMLKLHVEEAKMSVSETAVSMAVTWSHPRTPAGRTCVTIGNEHTSSRITERSFRRVSKTEKKKTSSVQADQCHVRRPDWEIHRQNMGDQAGCREKQLDQCILTTTTTMITRPVRRPPGLTHVHVYTVETLITQSMKTVSGSHLPVEIKSYSSGETLDHSFRQLSSKALTCRESQSAGALALR